MTKDELLKEISQTLYKVRADKLAQLAATTQNLGLLLDLTFYPKKEIAFRAAWILETVYFNNPVDFIPHLNDFKSAYCLQKNLSCQRHFTKIMMNITSSKSEVNKASVHIAFDFEA